MLRVLLLRCVIMAFAAGFLAGCTNEVHQKDVTVQDVPHSRVTTATPGATLSGEVLFKQYCFSCHPNGGNVSDSGNTLYGSALKRNHIITPEDVVRIMRNPKSRMIRFDVSTLSDKDARAIAEYILTAFK